MGQPHGKSTVSLLSSLGSFAFSPGVGTTDVKEVGLGQEALKVFIAQSRLTNMGWMAPGGSERPVPGSIRAKRLYPPNYCSTTNTHTISVAYKQRLFGSHTRWSAGRAGLGLAGGGPALCYVSLLCLL